MMEQGFFHPDRGYWQTNADTPDHIRAAYPEGTIEVPLKPGAGHEWQNGGWEAVLPDPVVALAAAKAHGQAAMLAWISDFTAQFTGDTPLDERLSWDAKEAAARAQIAGAADAQQAALLADEAALTGETVDNLALLILANADLYRAIVARVAGLRRLTRDAINAAETPEAVQAVLDGAKAQALALAAALGIAP